MSYRGLRIRKGKSRILIKIYDAFDRSAVKIHRRAFVSCSRVKAYNFSGFVNISSETFLGKLSPFNELRIYATMAIDEANYVVQENIRVTRLLLFADWPEKIFLPNQKRAIQPLLELVR